MSRGWWFLGVVAGATLMYMVDPRSGRRRRALFRDKLVRAGHVTRDAVEGRSRDLANRSRGLVAITRRYLSGSNRQEQTT
jgi:hyperosmotically inducible periplasmic protein